MKNNYLLIALLSLSFLFLDKTDLPAKPTHAGVKLNIKVFLQGALLGVPDGTNLMRDDLRLKNYFPLTEPYTALGNFHHVGGGGNETISNPNILKVKGPNAIVDWVFVELRSPANPQIVLETRSALLQRDGDVVDTDGLSPLLFQSAEPGEYYVAVRHRNHLPVMSLEVFELSDSPQSINFSDLDFPTYGMNAQVDINGLAALQGGDVNSDGRTIFMGPGNDVFKIFASILYDPLNTNFSANFISHSYSSADVNMDGDVIYAGPKSDVSALLYGIIYH